MISTDVISTDHFINISLEARGLYMHLNVVADDDGFISSPIATSDKPTDYGSKMEPQIRKDKNSIAKNNIVKKNSFCDFPQREYPPDFYDKLEQAAAQRI